MAKSQKQIEHEKELARQKAAIQQMMHSLQQRREQYQRLLPKGMDVDWFFAEVRVGLARAPKLADCDMISVFDSLTTCAQLGLSPSGRLGSAYLIPYGKRCTLVVGYKGYVDLAYRSGEVVGFQAQIVYRKDEFEWEEGLEPKLRHIRSEEADPGPMRAVYAVGLLRGGYRSFVVMTGREVAAIKARSKGAERDDSPWKTDEPEMWKKTAIRRLIKLLPLSPQKAQGLARAQEAEDAVFEEVDVMAAAEEDTASDAATSGMDKLQKTLEAGAPRQTLEFTQEREKVPVSRQPGEDDGDDYTPPEPPPHIRTPGS